VVVDGDERETGLLGKTSCTVPEDSERIGFGKLDE